MSKRKAEQSSSSPQSPTPPSDNVVKRARLLPPLLDVARHEETLYFGAAPLDCLFHLSLFLEPWPGFVHNPRALRYHSTLPGIRPRAMCFDREGHLTVALSGKNEVSVYDVGSGALLRKIGEGQHTFPSGCAVDFNGKIYVSEYAESLIKVFSASGALERQFVVTCPRGLALSADGRLLYACTHPFDVKMFRARDGLDMGGIKVLLTSTNDVAICSAQRIAISHQQDTSGAVTTVHNSGYEIRTFGEYQVTKLARLAVDPYDNIYVANNAKNEVLVFSVEGQPITVLKSKGTDAEGKQMDFHDPCCIAISQDGLIAISDFDGVALCSAVE